MDIISWNINGIGKRHREVPNILNDCDILCLSETRLCDSSKYQPRSPNYNCIRKDRGVGNGGGLIVFLHKNIIYSSIYLQRIPQGVEIIGLKFHYDQLWIHLFSLYIPPNSQVKEEDLKDLFRQMENFENCIITGDLNAHNDLWGSDLVNSRGNWLAGIITDCNFNVLNTGSPTRVHPSPGRISVPDISLSSNDISLRINWETIQDVRGSDHFPMRMSISGSSFHKLEIHRRIGTKRVDWQSFREQMSEAANNLPKISQDNHLEVYCTMIEDIKRALKASGALMLDAEGKRSNPRIPVPVEWWDDDCKKAVEERKRTFKVYQSNSSDDNWDAFIAAEKFADKTIKEKKTARIYKVLQFTESLQKPSSDLETAERL